MSYMINHIHIKTDDPDKVAELYAEAFGFEIISRRVRDFNSKLMDYLYENQNTLSSFFEGNDSVMVMVNDNQIRNNRLSLLFSLNSLSKELADFDKIN